MKRFYLLALLLAAPSAFGAYDGPVSHLADRIVCRVNQTPITLSEVEESVLRRRMSDPAAADLPAREIYQQELRALIEEELLYQEAERRKIEVPDELLGARIDEVMDQIQSALGSADTLRQKLLEHGLTLERLKTDLQKRELRQMKIARAISARFVITDADVKAYADKLASENKPAESYFLRQILVRCASDATEAMRNRARERAFEAAVAVQKGMKFEDAVAKFSEDPVSREQGGELGWVNKGAMVEPLEKAVENLEVGQISQPVRVRSGFAVVEIMNTRTARKMLFADRFEQERKKLLDELMATEPVDINPSFLDLLPED